MVTSVLCEAYLNFLRRLIKEGLAVSLLQGKSTSLLAASPQSDPCQTSWDPELETWKLFKAPT